MKCHLYILFAFKDWKQPIPLYLFILDTDRSWPTYLTMNQTPPYPVSAPAHASWAQEKQKQNKQNSLSTGKNNNTRITLKRGSINSSAKAGEALFLAPIIYLKLCFFFSFSFFSFPPILPKKPTVKGTELGSEVAAVGQVLSMPNLAQTLESHGRAIKGDESMMIIQQFPWL